MATLKQVVDGDSTGISWLKLEDSDGKLWKYAKGSTAQDGAVVHIAQRPDKKLEILVADDGKPLLRQDAPGLPRKMVVHLEPAGGSGPGPGIPVTGGWSGGDYEYEISDRRLLQSIALGNFLSYGPEMPRLLLGNLNVLVGPNGSGKSNLLEAISLLRSSPNDLRSVILSGGGVGDWIWKGKPEGNATVEAIFANPDGLQPLRHVLAFRAEQQSFRLEDERIENEQPYPSQAEPYFYYRYQKGRPVINTRGKTERNLRRESVKADLSILAQMRDPESYPEITYLSGVYEGVRLYREWAFGRNTVFRVPQKADQRNDRLEENFANLGMFLNRLLLKRKVKAVLLERLRDLYEGLTDFHVSIEGGSVQVFFIEGDFSIPATRLSDGSLRYLCLLAILCDPEPPPLIGLEEPELGLHPDLLPKLADLLLAAAQRTQLIVTTHSDILVDALTDHPDALIICEKHEGHTALRRLTQEEVQPWLEKYRLGQLWTQGQLGGTRW